MSHPADPTPATVKRLFACSGNRCAFPSCRQTLVHEAKVTARICHIKARSAGGPRYDPGQSDAERRHYDNLLLLCPAHSDVIDADAEAYTVERLRKMKSDHEAKNAGGKEPSDEIARALIDLSGAKVTNGSIIVTQNQVGGQVAHVINNYGPPKRIVTPQIRERMLAVLAEVAPARIGFASTQGDIEAHGFKLQLMTVFRDAGWQVEDMQTFMFFGSHVGLVLTIPFASSDQGLPQTVAHALAQTGNPVNGNRGDMANSCGFYVQVWNAPQ